MKPIKKDITTREAGRMGGKTTLERKGLGFFKEIGKLGGLKVSEDREHMRQIAKRSHQVRRKNQSPDIAKAHRRVSMNRKWDK